MFGSHVLETALGLAFLFFFLSIVCSGLNEFVMTALNQRARYLRRGVEHLLRLGGNEALIDMFYESKLIDDLRTPSSRISADRSDPSYIPSRTFADNVLDLLANKVGADDKLADLRAEIEKLPVSHPLHRGLKAALDGIDPELDRVWAELQTWFDDAMDRVTGWYRRSARVTLVVLGALVVGSMNIDALDVADRLWTDEVVRAALVAEAETTITTPESSATETATELTPAGVREELTSLEDLGLHFGWQAAPEGTMPWIRKVIGLLTSVIAIGLGAPFWFDVMSRASQLRNTGPSQD